MRGDQSEKTGGAAFRGFGDFGGFGAFLNKDWRRATWDVRTCGTGAVQ